MPEAPAHRFRTRVYWEDTDGAGIVYYANYLKFAERGRTEMLRSIGIEQRSMLAETGIAFAVRRCACEYIRPARLDDELDVATRVTGARAASIEMRQLIQRGAETLAELDVMVVCMTRDGRPARLPPAIRHALAPFVANTD
ncbi:MAG: tol-pal system-associated acyl-CoA thioesterase [Alphaproteobacteria bacterium]|nr:tol-pal system-associated acyl-CoA thioesterase [Alphaproteobacteria bacterium]